MRQFGKLLLVTATGLLSLGARADFTLTQTDPSFSEFATIYSGSATWTFEDTFNLTFRTTVTGSENVQFTLTDSTGPHHFSYLLASATGGDQTHQFLLLDAGTYTFDYTATVEDHSIFGARLSASIAPVAVAVPEPETYAMLLAGLGVMGLIARRRLS